MTGTRHWVALGDIHEQTEGIDAIPELEGAEALFLVGDLTNRGDETRMREVLAALGAGERRIFAVIGNMDREEAAAALDREGMNLHGRVVDLGDGVFAAGMGYSPPTPFGTPSEVPESRLEEMLRELEAKLPDPEQLIVVCHTPPVNTAADRLSNGTHVGSRAVREFLERVGPAVCLTGHIHESKGVDRIGRTVVVNPGLFAWGGYVVLSAAGGTLDVRLKERGA